jgi:uroporphyrinogen decarboxylase
MRQAGRYQPEYRATRAKLPFIEMCRRSDVATEVTLRPVEQLGVDAAIVFADILLVLEPLGIGFEFTESGPRIPSPIRTPDDIAGVQERIDAKSSLGYVMETLRMTRAALPQDVPLIGFAGAPFTLASYVIEGGGSRDYARAKQLMFTHEDAWNALMTKLTDAIVDYLRAQVNAGADALQVFDSWVGALSPSDYQRYVAPHMKRLFASLDVAVPVIHFGTGNAALYPHMRAAGGDVIGVDWRTELDVAWRDLEGAAVMGNLDPTALLGPRDELLKRAKAVLDAAGGRAGHVFNLGHGVLPMTPVDNAKALVDFVHEQTSR